MFSQSLYFTNTTLLTAAGSIGQSLRIKGQRITAIDDPPQKHDRIIDCQDGVLIPGLINAHDHLELNTFKRLKYQDTYTHSLQWIEDIEARFDTDPDLTKPRAQPLADRLLVGAFKNFLSGVTTVCHHNPLHRPLRYGYPIRVVKDYGFSHSLFRDDDLETSYKKTKVDHPWIIHLAEGVDATAATEFEQLDQLGVLGDNTILVHGVGLTPDQRQTLIDRGGGLIWCPGSNHFLFGQTAKVQSLAQAGKLALGSDSRLSGEFDLLNELQFASRLNQLSPQDLFRAVTVDAARVLRLGERGLGQIAVGGEADLALLPPSDFSDEFFQLLDMQRTKLELVMVAGKPLVGSLHMQPVFEATKTDFAPVLVDEFEKIVSKKLVSRLKNSSVQEPGVEVL